MIGGGGAAAPPPVPKEFAGLDHLGPVRSVTVVPASRRVTWLIGLGALWAIAIGIGAFLVALVLSLFSELLDDLAFVIWGVVWAIGLVVVARWLRRKASQAVVVYEDGVAVHDGKAVRAWRWDDLVAVERRPVVRKPDIPSDTAGAIAIVVILAAYKIADRPYVKAESTYAFGARDGGSFVLDRWLPDVDELADAIDLEVTRRQAPAIRAALHAGREVGFGAITLSRDAIAVGDRTFRWPQFERIEVELDTLHVTAAGTRRAAVKVSDVPNLTLLLSLLPELAG